MSHRFYWIEFYMHSMKALAGESKVYIRPSKNLIAQRGLSNALKLYRERYTWSQYHLLCHLVLSSTHHMMV